MKDDKFAVIANSNKSCQVAIKTPWGSKTERIEMKNIEMQGTVLAGLKCSVSIDTIGKEFLDNTHDVTFRYKNCVTLPPLSLIDDIICVTNCSKDSIIINSIIQSKLQGKQLFVDTDGVVFNDIFGILEKQVKAAKVMMKITRNRKLIIENSSILGSQAHL